MRFVYLFETSVELAVEVANLEAALKVPVTITLSNFNGSGSNWIFKVVGLLPTSIELIFCPHS